MNQASIDLKIPSEWWGNLQELANKNNQSVQELILEILAKYLDVDYPTFSQGEILEEIKKLTDKIDKLERENYHFKKVSDKVNMLEKLIVYLQNQGINSKAIKNFPLRDEEQDLEDEPDEILISFLDNSN